MLFYRTNHDKKNIDCTDALRDMHGGTAPTTCVILGAGPSLERIDSDVARKLSNAPVTKFAVNHGGRGPHGEGWIIKPNLWTTFDNTHKFSGVLFQDPSITKFVRPGSTKKQYDMVPGTTYKLCDCPNTYFISHEHVAYGDFFDPDSDTVTNQIDSLIQAICIAIKLGYRHLHLIGCELVVKPSEAMVEKARSLGVDYCDETGVLNEAIPKRLKEEGKAWEYRSDLLEDFVLMVGAKATGLDPTLMLEQCGDDLWKLNAYGEALNAGHKVLGELEQGSMYCFGEKKSLADMCRSDRHYFDTVQRLRLSRRKLTKEGVWLTHQSEPYGRLIPWFDELDANHLQAIWTSRAGSSYETEDLRGCYSRSKTSFELPYHKDILPIVKTREDREEQFKKMRQKKEAATIPQAVAQPASDDKKEVKAVAVEMLKADVEIKETA